MAFVKTVQQLDWNRVLLTGANRHAELSESDSGHKSDLMGALDDDQICPNCIIWALLSETTSGGPTGAYRREDTLKDVKVPADWWHAWLYGDVGDPPRPGPAEAIRILMPLIIEAAEEIEVKPPEEDDDE
jgi:hypothetical protein